MRKISFWSLFISFCFAGCLASHSVAWQEIQDNLQKIRQSVVQSSDNFTYANKDLDLKFIAEQVDQIQKQQTSLFADEADFGRKAVLSADLFYLSEFFERSYAEDNLTAMQDTRAKIAELLDGRSGALELLVELDDFILAEEAYKKYLANEITENKFSEVVKAAESEKLFELFYRFIDNEILFGERGIDFQE